MIKKEIVLGGGADFVEVAVSFFANTEKFNVRIAEDGDSALSMLVNKPDLALLDIDLPIAGGDECCRAAKQAGLSPPTLIVLAATPENRRALGRCLDAGCDAIIPKPLMHHRLARVVTRLLFKRNHTPSRFPVHLPVRYGVQPDLMTENHSANLNTKGLFIETDKLMPVGTPVHVLFTLPDGGAIIECTARVAWLNDQTLRSETLLPYGMGLEFLDLDERQANAILEFLYMLVGTYC